MFLDIAFKRSSQVFSALIPLLTRMTDGLSVDYQKRKQSMNELVLR